VGATLKTIVMKWWKAALKVDTLFYVVLGNGVDVNHG
jgi:hypothetical protein